MSAWGTRGRQPSLHHGEACLKTLRPCEGGSSITTVSARYSEICRFWPENAFYSWSELAFEKKTSQYVTWGGGFDAGRGEGSSGPRR
jgi:hypothetical protein